MAAGFTDGESSRFALTDRIRDFDLSDPDYLIQPIVNRDAARMLGVTRANLSVMRYNGVAPPGYGPTALGLYYPSRHDIILWAMGRENVASELQSLAAAYPWKGMSHAGMVERAIDIHPQRFEQPLNAVEAGTFVNRTPKALHSALDQERGDFAKLCHKDGRMWRYGTRASLLSWFAEELQQEVLEVAA